jgi:hypothetical protein
MKKLLTIPAAVILMTLMCFVSAQAWTLGTTDQFTLTYDGDTISMDATNFNFSVEPDPHMWDSGYTGPYGAYNSSHKFQSGPDAFYLIIDSLTNNITGFDRQGTDASITPVYDLTWAITLDTNKNSPIRGYSVSDLSVVGGTITGTLVSDGIFHWYGNYPDTNMTTAEGYNPNFNFIFTGTDNGNGTYTGTMTLYATPIPASALLLGSGLMGMGLLGWRRQRS